MPVRDFDAARKERLRERDPVQFQLGGETFTLLARIPLGDALDLADAPEPTPDTLAECVVALTKFIDRVLIDADRPRFAALLRRRDDAIDPWTIIDLGAWIAEEYAGRPTSPSADFSVGRPSNGETSSSNGSTPVAASAT